MHHSELICRCCIMDLCFDRATLTYIWTDKSSNPNAAIPNTSAKRRNEKKSQASAPTRFRFVGDDKAPENLKSTRSHAMREYWRQKKLQSTRNPKATVNENRSSRTPSTDLSRVSFEDDGSEKSNSGTERSSTDEEARIRRGEYAIDRRRTEGDWTIVTEEAIVAQNSLSCHGGHNGYVPKDYITNIAGSQVDPFSRLAFDCGPETQKLLYHCKGNVGCFIHFPYIHRSF
jgi:hypothetical protein